MSGFSTGGFAEGSMKATAYACGKLNLTLDVLQKRPDGYHDIVSVMQTVALCDEITVETYADGFSAASDCEELPEGEGNLALLAAKAFAGQTGFSKSGVRIFIKKRIPLCAGLGGGSADAAAVLRALNELFGAPLPEEKLLALALALGSDVPFCLIGGTALAKGRGEALQKLPGFPHCLAVICKPPFGLTAGEMYRRADEAASLTRPDTGAMAAAIEARDLKAAASKLQNVFEPLVAREHPEVVDIKNILLDAGALGASITGKGPSMFGLFDDEKQANAAYCRLKALYEETFLTKIE